MNGKTSIEAMWRIKTLTEQFGPCGLGWYYVPVRKWTETIGEEVAVFVDIELYVKFGEEWSKPIPGTGGDMLASREKSGIYVSDECYKKATTDAISVACKQLGIGADVYWEADKAKHTGNGASDSSSRPTPSGSSYPSAISNPGGLELKYVDSLWKELKRTGIGLKSLLRNYGKEKVQELSFQEYKDAMNNLTSKPDKPLDPRFIPPNDQGDPASPWNGGTQKTKEKPRIAPVQETMNKNKLSAELIEDGYTYCGSFGGN